MSAVEEIFIGSPINTRLSNDFTLICNSSKIGHILRSSSADANSYLWRGSYGEHKCDQINLQCTKFAECVHTLW